MQSIRQMENIELTEDGALARLDEFWQAAEVDAHALRSDLPRARRRNHSPDVPENGKLYRAELKSRVRLMKSNLSNGSGARAARRG